MRVLQLAARELKCKLKGKCVDSVQDIIFDVTILLIRILRNIFVARNVEICFILISGKLVYLRFLINRVRIWGFPNVLQLKSEFNS